MTRTGHLKMSIISFSVTSSSPSQVATPALLISSCAAPPKGQAHRMQASV